MARRVIIRGLSTISALGVSSEEVRQRIDEPSSTAVSLEDNRKRPVFSLTDSGEEAVREVQQIGRYGSLDRVAQLAIACCRDTLRSAGGRHGAIGCVTIGSSRGATSSLEKTIAEFSLDPSGVPTETSPTTTAGNISSWVAQECLARRSTEEQAAALASIGTSMTCTSAFQSLLVALAFIRSGLTETALFGGAEACLTPYTVAQLEALRIYSSSNSSWPCRPTGAQLAGGGTVVLGEGAGTALLMLDDGAALPGDLELLGVGWAVEETPSSTGLSADGLAFERSMRDAMAAMSPQHRVDTVVLHAPGSIKGDDAELAAVKRVFGEEVMVCSTKHLTGHTYGASGMVSLGMAQALLEGARWRGFPFPHTPAGSATERPRVVLINTAGFGGNSITVAVARAGARN